VTKYEEKYIESIEPILEEKFVNKRFDSKDLEDTLRDLTSKEIGHSLSYVEQRYDGLYKLNHDNTNNPVKWFYNPDETLYSERYEEVELENSYANNLNKNQIELYDDIVREIETNGQNSVSSDFVRQQFNQYVSENESPGTPRERITLIGSLRSDFLENYDVLNHDEKYVLEKN